MIKGFSYTISLMNGTVLMKSHTDIFTSKELAEIALEAVKLNNAKNGTPGLRIAYSDITECNIMQYASDVKLLPVLEWENEMKGSDRSLRIAAGYWRHHYVAWDEGESAEADCRFYVMLDDVELFTISREQWESYLDEMLEAGMMTEDRRYILIEEAEEACRYKENPSKEREKWEKRTRQRDKKLNALEGEILKLTGRDKMFDWPCKIFCAEYDKKWWRNYETVLVYDYPGQWKVMQDDDAFYFLSLEYDEEYDLCDLPIDTFYALYRLLRENGLCKEPPGVSRTNF